MTTPARVVYATVADLRTVLSATDDTGTAAKLTDAQLTLALQSASSRVSTYSGTLWDSSTPQAVPPDLVHDVTLDLAAFYATVRYLKHKAMGQDHPLRVAYNEAMKTLNDLRDGKIRPDASPPGSVGMETGTVINPLPGIFTWDDSNTFYDPGSGTIAASTPSDQGLQSGLLGDYSGVEAP